MQERDHLGVVDGMAQINIPDLSFRRDEISSGVVDDGVVEDDVPVDIGLEVGRNLGLGLGTAATGQHEAGGGHCQLEGRKAEESHAEG